MAVYATSADLIARKDLRSIGDLLTDNGNQVTAEFLATNVNLAAALLDASGDIDGALLIGNRFTTDQLEALTGNSLGHLKRLCCELTMCHLESRRIRGGIDQIEKCMKVKEALLYPLQSGKDVFNIDVHLSAGVVNNDGPTTQFYDSNNLIRDRVRRYYPDRVLPRNR